MKTVLTMVANLVLVSAAAAQLAPFWIPEPGCRGYFSEEHSFTWYVEAQEPLTLASVLDPRSEWELRTYEFDEENDLCWAHTQGHGAGSLSDYYEWFTPPVKVVDFPLVAGRTWQTTSQWRRAGYGLARTCIVTGTVVGPCVVETGIGPLDVIEITLGFDFSGGPPDATHTYFLHEQLGDVNHLLSLANCSHVPADVTTWSEVKALYR